MLLDSYSSWRRRERKKLAVLCRAVLCRAVVLKSPGVYLVSEPAVPYRLANHSWGVLLKPQRLCHHVTRHYQPCWAEPLAVDELLTNYFPRLLYWSPTKTRELNSDTVCAKPGFKQLSNSRKYCFYLTHCLLCSTYTHSWRYYCVCYWPHITMRPQVQVFHPSCSHYILYSWFSTVSCLHRPCSTTCCFNPGSTTITPLHTTYSCTFLLTPRVGMLPVAIIPSTTHLVCLPCLQHPSTSPMKDSSTSPPHGKEKTTL